MLFSVKSIESVEPSPLVIHTTLTWPPASSTRRMSPAQHKVSSSGWGETTNRDVLESRVGRPRGVGVAAGAGATLAESAAVAARSAVVQEVADREVAA